MAPLQTAFQALALPYEEWFLDEGKLNLSVPPPEGIFYNRMSASSHTRDHRFAPEYTAAVLSWLEAHGRRVVNNNRALQLEISKVAQYVALENYGVKTPLTIAAIGKQHIIEAARQMTGSFITKHNRAGKGLGVKLFHHIDALQDYVNSVQFDPSVDGITLIQQYIRAPQPFITRVEFVGGKFLYAVRVDTSLGFELCPADVCQIGDAFCPVGETGLETPTPRFQIIKDFNNPIIQRYQRFIAANGIEVAGIEFIVDERGELYTYDVNTNTNYNSDAEAEAGLSGMHAIAQYLGQQLHELNKGSV